MSGIPDGRRLPSRSVRMPASIPLFKAGELSFKWKLYILKLLLTLSNFGSDIKEEITEQLEGVLLTLHIVWSKVIENPTVPFFSILTSLSTKPLSSPQKIQLVKDAFKLLIEF